MNANTVLFITRGRVTAYNLDVEYDIIAMYNDLDDDCEDIRSSELLECHMGDNIMQVEGDLDSFEGLVVEHLRVHSLILAPAAELVVHNVVGQTYRAFVVLDSHASIQQRNNEFMQTQRFEVYCEHRAHWFVNTILEELMMKTWCPARLPQTGCFSFDEECEE